MSQIKYLPVEIDGVNVFDPIERLLVDTDVAVNSLVLAGPNVHTALLGLQAQITGIVVGVADFSLILTEPYGWTVLMDQNGNVLSKGFLS
jgi:hypothetical protein